MRLCLFGKFNTSKLIQFIRPKVPLRLFSSENLRNQSEPSIMIELNSERIEMHKRDLYDMISRRRDYSSATELCNQLMKTKPNLHLYNVILKGQLMMKNSEGIKSVLLAITKNGLAFNTVTLNLLLVYYRDLGMMEEAEKLFEKMCAKMNEGEESDLFINCAGPNLSAFTTMMSGYAKEGNFPKTLEFYEKMLQMQKEANGPAPDQTIKNCLLTAAVNSGQFKAAKTIYEEIEREFMVNAVTRKTWLKAMMMMGEGSEEIFGLFGKMMDENREEVRVSDFMEILRWVLEGRTLKIAESDISKRLTKRNSLLLGLLELGLNNGIRLYDYKLTQNLLDALKPTHLDEFTKLALKFPKDLLFHTAGRLIGFQLAKGNGDLCAAIREQLETLNNPNLVISEVIMQQVDNLINKTKTPKIN